MSPLVSVQAPVSHSLHSFTIRELLQTMLVALAAALICLPFLLAGVPGGHDAWTHVMYQHYFSRQFWGGDLHPLWLEGANKGYGSPVFLAQYPLPYYVTALLRPLLRFPASPAREARELGVYCFLSLAAAGIFARAWFRRGAAPWPSTIAAMIYMALPYMLGQVLYGRVAIGELTALAWVPLLLAVCDTKAGWVWLVCATGGIFALLIVSDVLYAALFAPLAVAYAAADSRQRLWPTAGGLLAGCGLASFYLIPLLAFHRLFRVDRLARFHAVVEVGRNLIYVTAADVHGHRFGWAGIGTTLLFLLLVSALVWRSGLRLRLRAVLLVLLLSAGGLAVPGLGPSLIAASGLPVSGFESFASYSMLMFHTACFTLGLAVLAFCRLARQGEDGPQDRVLLTACGAAFLLMSPWSAVLWRVMPGTAVLQFPWRLAALLTIAAAGLLARGLDIDWAGRGRGLLLVALAIVAVGAVVWRIDTQLRPLRVPQVADDRWVDQMYVTYVSPDPGRYAALLGASPYSFSVAPTPLQAAAGSAVTAGQCAVSVVALAARQLFVSADCARPSRVRLNQTWFPLWRVGRASGTPADVGASPDGLLELRLGAGPHEFEMLLDPGWPLLAGELLSAVSFGVLAEALLVSALTGLRLRAAQRAPEPVAV